VDYHLRNVDYFTFGFGFLKVIFTVHQMPPKLSDSKL